MAYKVYVLNDRVVFWPDKNILTDNNNAPKQVQLTVPASRCLELMVAKMELVTQDELYEYGWKGATFTPSPNTLYQCISVLRRAFKEICDEKKSYILTETRRGFRINPDVKVSSGFRELSVESENVITDEDSSEDPSIEKGDSISPESKIISFKSFTVFLVSSILLAICVIWMILRTDDLFLNYEKSTLLEDSNCVIYQSTQSRNYSLNKEVLSLLPCRDKPFNYVTTYPYSSTVSIISCDKNINSHPKSCSSLYLRNKNDHK